MLLPNTTRKHSPSHHVGKKIISSQALLLLFTVIFIAPINSHAGLSLIEKSKVITVTAQTLAEINVKTLDNYSLAAVKDGRLEPIPFQIDEISKDGFVMIDGEDSIALKLEGVKSHIEGKRSFFDGNDQLLFMLRDAGPKKTRAMQNIGDMIAELEVKTADGTTQYVYVVEGARIQSEDYYVRYSSELGRAETDFYTLMVNQKNALVWEEFSVESYDGKHPKKPFDTMKLGLSANVLVAGGIPLAINNKDLKAKVLAQKAGPIRATSTFRQTLTFLKVPLFVSKLQVRHYESKVQYDFILRMPEARRQALANLRISMSMDGWDLKGSDIVFSKHPDKKALVDGQVSEAELALLDDKLSLDEEKWIWLDTHNNFSTLMSYNLQQYTKFEKDFNKAKIRYKYKDNNNKKSRMEFHEGQLPDVGFEAKLPQFGRIHMTYTYDMFSKDLKQNVPDIAKGINSQPLITVKYL